MQEHVNELLSILGQTNNKKVSPKTEEILDLVDSKVIELLNKVDISSTDISVLDILIKLKGIYQ